MARQPSSAATSNSNAPLASTAFVSHFREDPHFWIRSSRGSNPMASVSFAHQRPQSAYLMPTSPAKGRRGSTDYRPVIRKAQGNVPACLVNASVTYCNNDQIYAFGGFDQFTDEVYNHVLRLDLKTLRWELVDNYGDIPGVRMGHTATLYQGDKLIVFGGENEHREYLSDIVILHIPTSTWTQPEIRGQIPRGRGRHAAVIYDEKLFVIGGVTGENNVILDDLSYLDLKTWTWSRSWRFTARFDHTAWVWGDRLWIFGGLDPDMERTTDIWWLDLKGSPFLGTSSSNGTMESPGTTGRMTQSPDTMYSSPTQQLPGRSGSYAANSGSVQVRGSGRRKPIAPGAISCLKFRSGPHVPTLCSGTHFQAYASGVLLDLITPSETVRTYECNLSSLELDTLRWQKLADGQEIFKPGYRWHYCTVNPNGTQAWLLGCSLDAGGTPGTSDENHMSQVLCIDLEKYGLLGNELTTFSPDQGRVMGSEGSGLPPLSGLGADLSAVFDQSPQSGSDADFIITANPDDLESLEEATAEDASPSQTQPEFLPPNAPTSPPIHVHRIILQLRWPHFKRLYSAQMAEYHSKRMHIPEPYSVVRAFLYYLYTDSISGHPEYCSSIIDVAGMLVMANLYDMPKLRLLCVNRLSRELDVENAAIVWERAGRTNEDWLMRRAAQFCLSHWGRIVRTEGFKSLSRQSLIELCEVVDMEGRIVAGPELELVGALGTEGLDLSRDAKRSRPSIGGAMTDDLDDLDGDEVDGMEIA
ncbi:Kelch motif domain protein [Aspergillus clavatus NRRL 1]|uniref:Kelch repeat protein n=1 Tax=Aspergillus clavatus (strain ATCC 1007 / CBS 513.65 / DSM 816 / NCTC 3887 / NRRL 1 / QM 1276 / 107) TaxID=344612 RepID=A1CNY7_ASPCL|nr:kelch repeat protein [Aspergillus clavatus NRRL 1]EAW07358.1 kelch repeat protein [Aspergillus clavatus NRRL 1]